MRAIQKCFVATVTFFMVVSISVAEISSNNIPEALLAQDSSIVNGSNCPIIKNWPWKIEPRDMAGTTLKTKTFYKISMKKYPSSVLTYTAAGRGEYNYVYMDYNTDSAKNYFSSGTPLPHAQWEFIPLINCGKLGWFRIRNRCRPNQYLTWSAGELAYPDGRLGYYAVVESNKQNTISSHDFAVKPVRVYDGNKPTDYYQLVFKELPKGVVTFSHNEYKKDTRFLIVDNINDSNYMDKYNKTGEWYDDTLFSFDMPVIAEGGGDSFDIWTY